MIRLRDTEKGGYGNMMNAKMALDLIWDLRRQLDAIHSGKCPDCGEPVSLRQSHEGTAAWYCPRCSRRARALGQWHGGYGWLTKQAGYWVIVDSGDPERQRAQLEAYSVAAARGDPNWGYGRDPQAATLSRLAWQVQNLARYLNYRVSG
jgi:ribosomal protein L37AE/L43A